MTDGALPTGQQALQEALDESLDQLAKQADALRESELLQHLAAGTATSTGADFFRSLVQHLASALDVRYAFVTQCTDVTLTRVRTLALWMGKEFGENIEYSLAGTPCENVIRGEACYYPNDLQRLFPKDEALVDWKAEGFLGIPIRDSWENILGHLAALDDKPMAETPRGMSILQIFAARAGAELERKRAEEALRRNFEELAKKNRYETIVGTVTRAVHQSINLQDVLDNAVQALSKHVDRADGVGICLVEGDVAVLKAHRGLSDRYLESAARLSRGEGFPWRVIQESKRRYCADVDQDRLFDAAGREMGVRSYLCEPIRREGRTVGTINVLSFQRDAFDEDELKLLEIVAQQIETAIGNAQQAEALRQSQEALQAALKALEQSKDRLQVENVYLQEEIRAEHNFEEIVGASAAIKRVFRSIEKMAGTDTTALITGETGTGKELIARAIHNLSGRNQGVLVKVNCGAIPAGLIESELFGHEKGAFTGAVARKIGRFEVADGGTIFLDEIGDLPLDLQVKLLRVLQEGEIERVGSTRTLKVDVRVIAATHQDLETAVAEGRFRQDLYYRLNVFPVRVPPLRERREDIAPLVRYFVLKLGAKMGKRIDIIPKAALDALTSYDWPGNIRELANVVERSLITSRGSSLDLGDWGAARTDSTDPADSTIAEMERRHIEAALERTGWRVSGPEGAARLLGLKPTTLEARMKKLGIARPK